MSKEEKVDEIEVSDNTGNVDFSAGIDVSFTPTMPRKVSVAVIGVGNIGKPLLRQIHEQDVFDKIVGLDIGNISLVGVEDTVIDITTSREILPEMDIVIVCVSSSSTFADFVFGLDLKAGALIIIETTLPVGGTEEVIDKFTDAGSILGEDIFIAYCPERIDTLEWNDVTAQIKVVSANDAASLTKASSFYQLIGCDVTEINHTRKAEAVKLYENFSRLAQIEFANEFASFCVENDIPPIEVMMKAMTKTNVQNVLPGFVGGHCLPQNAEMVAKVTNNELLRKLAFNSQNRLNLGYSAIKEYFGNVYKVGDVYKEKRVLILGVGYKLKITTLEGSPAVRLKVQLEKIKLKTTLFDAYIDVYPDILGNAKKKYDIVVTFHKLPFYIKIIEKYLKDDGLLVDFTGAYFGLAPLYYFP